MASTIINHFSFSQVFLNPYQFTLTKLKQRPDDPCPTYPTKVKSLLYDYFHMIRKLNKSRISKYVLFIPNTKIPNNGFKSSLKEQSYFYAPVLKSLTCTYILSLKLKWNTVVWLQTDYRKILCNFVYQNLLELLRQFSPQIIGKIDFRGHFLLTIQNDSLLSDAISHLTLFPIVCIAISGRQNLQRIFLQSLQEFHS